MSKAQPADTEMRTSAGQELTEAIGQVNKAMEVFSDTMVALRECDDELSRKWELDRRMAGMLARMAAYGTTPDEDVPNRDVNNTLHDAAEGITELPTQLMTMAAIVCLTSTPQGDDGFGAAGDRLDAALRAADPAERARQVGDAAAAIMRAGADAVDAAIRKAQELRAEDGQEPGKERNGA